MPENNEAVRMFSIASSQVIMGFSGPAGLNIPAVIEVLKLYRVKRIARCVEQLLEMFSYFMLIREG